MSDRQELTERLIQLEAFSLVVDKITGEVFAENVEGDWSKSAFPLTELLREAHERETGLAAARVDLVAAQMFAELSVACEWFAENAREHAERANELIVEDVARRSR
jgi:hypothetical protein